MAHDNGEFSNLFDPQSIGGKVAQGGMTFQNEFALSQIPFWLANHGFESLLIEGMGDIEARFFQPEVGKALEFIEVKKLQLTINEFRKEIDRFMNLDLQNPGVYRKFTLVAGGLPAKCLSLLSKLQRIRNTDSFYEAKDPLMHASIDELTEGLVKLGIERRAAELIIRMVNVEIQLGPREDFERQLSLAFPSIAGMPHSKLREVAVFWRNLLADNIGKTIHRNYLESILIQANGEVPGELTTVQLHTETGASEVSSSSAITLHLDEFWGGSARKYPEKENWSLLQGRLSHTRDWILSNRTTRSIRLTGSRRLTTSLAIGYTFSAVSGFKVGVEYRDRETFYTEDYSLFGGTVVPPNVETLRSGTSGMAVILTVSRDIVHDANTYIAGNLDPEIAIIAIRIIEPIRSAGEANYLVREIKNSLEMIASALGISNIHLFFAGPAYFALLLGHRLNALPPIQCYEWVDGSHYVPTHCLSSLESEPGTGSTNQSLGG